ncbi:adhesion G-protein coupled receptor G4-like [Babylonia areolata]|uniref:adhesion G-protein coupled receptor G4-like n=1 Tax=Babylonia areolata TaxID=304850 RepID=UPI003FD056D8
MLVTDMEHRPMRHFLFAGLLLLLADFWLPSNADIILDGNWGSWGPYGSCSVTCGTGTKIRSRQCDNPPPFYGGSPCNGPSTDISECTAGSCPGTGAVPNTFFVYTASGTLGMYDMVANKSACRNLTLPLQVSDPFAVDYDPVEQRIHWTQAGLICSAHLDGSDLLQRQQEGYLAGGLAVDSASRLIVHADTYDPKITVFSLAVSMGRVVLRSGLQHPRAIELDAANGVMFWADIRAATIERANYDGSERRTVIGVGLYHPYALALDLVNGHLYWTDYDSTGQRNSLGKSDLFGRQRAEIFSAGAGTHIFALDVYNNHLYLSFTGRTLKAIYRYDMDGNPRGPICQGLDDIRDIHVVDSSIDVVATKCTTDRGGCSHICIPTTGGGRKCLCPDTYIMLEDQATCRVNLTLPALYKSDVTAETVRDMRNLVEHRRLTSAEDVVNVTSFLQQASQAHTVTPQMAKDMLSVVDTVAGLNQTVLQESNTLGNITNRLIQTMDGVADRVSLERAKGGQVWLPTKGTVLHVRNLTAVSSGPRSPFVGLQLLPDGPTHNVTSVTSLSDPDTYSNMVAAILLPDNITQHLPAGDDIRLSTSVIQHTQLFQEGHRRSGRDPGPDTADMPRNQTTSQTAGGGSGASQEVRLNSNVVSMRITVDGEPFTDLSASGLGHVTTVFRPLQTMAHKSSEELKAGSRCVFWDFALRQGRGGWSEEGCHLDSIHSGRVVCRCDHLTHFAVLMDVHGQEGISSGDVENLRTITVGGLTVSICALVLTLIFIVLITKLRTSLPHQILFNMALAMLLSWATFLAGIQRVESHVVCVAVAMLLHYSILVTFMWTLVQGYLYHVILAKGKAQPAATFLLRAATLAWGVPIIPVIILAAIDVNLYRGGEKFCWMSRLPLYCSFLAPIAVVIIINIVIYLKVMVRLWRRPNCRSNSNSYTATNVRISFSCFFMLGLNWIFGFLVVEGARVVFHYLFTIFAVTQGLALFILFIARDPAVREFCQKASRRGREVPDDRNTDRREPSVSRLGDGSSAGRHRSTEETSFTPK